MAFGKKAASKRGNGKRAAELKTTINFIDVDEKESSWSLAVPGILLIAVAAALFSKFAVVDRYGRLWEAEAEVSRLQAELDDGMEKIQASKELSDRFYHYTWSGMSEEEIDRTSRVDVAELVQYISTQVMSVNSYTLTGDQLTVNLTAPTLESISRLSVDVEERPIVGSCSMPTAQTNMSDTDYTDGVDAQIVVYIRTGSEIAGGERSESEEAEEESGSPMVDAARQARERTQQAEDMSDEDNN